jgi:hypothetical protein
VAGLRTLNRHGMRAALLQLLGMLHHPLATGAVLGPLPARVYWTLGVMSHWGKGASGGTDHRAHIAPAARQKC